jgi:hypothetical protein
MQVPDEVVVSVTELEKSVLQVLTAMVLNHPPILDVINIAPAQHRTRLKLAGASLIRFAPNLDPSLVDVDPPPDEDSPHHTDSVCGSLSVGQGAPLSSGAVAPEGDSPPAGSCNGDDFDKPFVEGGVLSPRQLAFLVNQVRADHNMGEREVEGVLQLLHKVISAFCPGHTFPQSLHLLMKLTQLTPVRHYERHACPKGCLVFEPQCQSLAECRKYMDQTCAVCGAARFVQLPRPGARGAVLLTPTQLFWAMFPLRDIAARAEADHEFASWLYLPEKPAATPGEEASEVGDIHGGSYFQKLRRPGGPLFSKATLACDIGADGFAPFKKMTYSLWAVALRLHNLPADEGAKAKNHFLLAIIPPSATGGTPPVFTPFLQPFKEQLAKAHSDGLFLPDPDWRPTSGLPRGVVRFDAVCVTGSFDNPARCKWCGFSNVAAYFSCFICQMDGHKRATCKHCTCEFTMFHETKVAENTAAKSGCLVSTTGLHVAVGSGGGMRMASYLDETALAHVRWNNDTIRAAAANARAQPRQGAGAGAAAAVDEEEAAHHMGIQGTSAVEDVFENVSEAPVPDPCEFTHGYLTIRTLLFSLRTFTTHFSLHPSHFSPHDG